MAPAFTHCFVEKISAGIKLDNAKCVLYNNQIFVLFIQIDNASVPIYCFDQEIAKWVSVDVNNSELLARDAIENEGDDYEVETRVENQFGLQIYRGFSNGGSARYQLDLGSLMWIRLPKVSRLPSFHSEIRVAENTYRIVVKSRSEVVIQLLTNDKICAEAALDAYPKHSQLKLINIDGKVYMVKIDYRSKQRDVLRIESDGTVTIVNSHPYTIVKSKSEYWVENNKIFTFKYGHSMKLEYFDTKTLKWNNISIGLKAYIRDVLSFFHQNGKMIIVFRAMEKSEFADENSIGACYLEFAPSLLTSSFVHYSKRIIENKTNIGEVTSRLPLDKHARFLNIHLMFLNQYIANQKMETRKLEKAKSRLIARQNDRGFHH